MLHPHNGSVTSLRHMYRPTSLPRTGSRSVYPFSLRTAHRCAQHEDRPTDRPHRNVRRIVVRPPCRLRRRNSWQFDYEMVHSEVYLNKYLVSIAPFSTPACPDCSQKYNISLNIENCSFCMFSIFNFSFIFRGDQLTPFAPMCGCPWDHGKSNIRSSRPRILAEN